ncbi:hypothetical protein [Segatella bryantii]|uniref:hypothetical protein n=1 Tax=Segatella bryantii TaxID=77095 RepID=UPI0028532BE4|nr:hypothetical protein [Segatella bryantii]MDR4931803.1 hypothetical protein [Segatella bryantii]
MKQVYNIVWADDEIDSLYDDIAKKLFRASGINVIKAFVNAKSLKAFLGETNSPIHAVVVDANFPWEEFKANKEQDRMGLVKVSQWVENFDFPFILFTGRKDLISGEEAEQFEYFTSNDLVVYKNPAEGIMPLINKIKDTVEFRNSTEWIIDNQYRMELECFKTIDSINNGHSYPLVRGLLIKGRDNTIMNAESYFNDIRTDVLGLMNSTAANFGIVPPDLSLNDFSYFLCLKSNKFSVIEPIMDQALSGVLQYVVTMTQDGSHGKESGLKFHIHDYVREKKDTLILKSIIFAVIELMNRFMEYVVNHTDVERNRMKWKAKSEGIK